MATGRKAKPTALKVVEGNPGKRALPKAEPKAKGFVLPPEPWYLSEKGKLAWAEFMKALVVLKITTTADQTSIYMAAELFAEIWQLREQIAEEGYTYWSQGEVPLLKLNPAVPALRAADNSFRQYLCEFGMTPASRTKVQVVDGSPTDEDDEAAEAAARGETLPKRQGVGRFFGQNAA